MPTVFEVVSERKPVKEKPSAAESGSKAKGSAKVRLVECILIRIPPKFEALLKPHLGLVLSNQVPALSVG